MSFYQFGQPVSVGLESFKGTPKGPEEPVAMKRVPFGSRLEHKVEVEEQDEAAFQKVQSAHTFREVATFISSSGGNISAPLAAAVLHRWARFVKQGACLGADVRRQPEFHMIANQLDATQLDPQSITNALWALGIIIPRRDYASEPFFRQIVQEFLRRREEFQPQNLSISVWAMATVDYRDDGALKAISKEVRLKLPEFKAQELSNTAWAFATLRYKDDGLYDLIAQRATDLLDTFNSQNLSNIAWAYSTIARQNDLLFNALTHQIFMRPRELRPLDLSNIGWAFAWMDYPQAPEAFKVMATVALEKLREFTGRELSNLLWAFDSMGIGPSRNERSFFMEVRHYLNTLPPKWFSKLAGEEMVKICNALYVEYSADQRADVPEQILLRHHINPLIEYLSCPSLSEEKYASFLKGRQIYHAGLHYTCHFLEPLGIRVMPPEVAKEARDDLVQYYFRDPHIASLTDQEPIGGEGPPDLHDMLDCKRRIQPSSHWIAGVLQITTSHRRVRRIIQALPADGGGLTFIKGDKQDARDEPRITSFETSALKGYNRDHHTEVVAAAYAETYTNEGPVEVQLYDPHYPCISCVGSIKQFLVRHPHASFVHGFSDWRDLQNVLRDERVRRIKKSEHGGLPRHHDDARGNPTTVKEFTLAMVMNRVSGQPTANGHTYYPIVPCLTG